MAVTCSTAIAQAMTAEAFDALLFPAAVAVPAASRPVPDWKAVHKELMKAEIKRMKLQSEALALDGGGVLSERPEAGRARQRWTEAAVKLLAYQERYGADFTAPGPREDLRRRAERAEVEAAMRRAGMAAEREQVRVRTA